MIQHSGQRPLQLHRVRPDGVAAAFAMRKRDDAIDVGGHGFAVEARRNQFGCMRRAVAGRDHRDIIARPHAPVFARES